MRTGGIKILRPTVTLRRLGQRLKTEERRILPIHKLLILIERPKLIISIDVVIYLHRSFKVAMSQSLLHGGDVNTSRKKKGTVGVSKPVRRDIAYTFNLM
mgnify:CR=1 FL=1